MKIKVATTAVTTKKTVQKQNALRERMRRSATLEMDMFPLTTEPDVKTFCHYLTEALGTLLSEKKPGSLTLTVHCRSLEILERVWEDYCSGHLDAVAEECFLTDETTKTKEERGKKSEADVDTIGLETIISEEDYLKCKKFLKEISGKLSS